MGFKLKEGWFAYFIAGLFAGFAFFMYGFEVSGKQINTTWFIALEWTLGFIILSVLSFVVGCWVRKINK